MNNFKVLLDKEGLMHDGEPIWPTLYLLKDADEGEVIYALEEQYPTLKQIPEGRIDWIDCELFPIDLGGPCLIMDKPVPILIEGYKFTIQLGRFASLVEHVKKAPAFGGYRLIESAWGRFSMLPDWMHDRLTLQLEIVGQKRKNEIDTMSYQLMQVLGELNERPDWDI